MADFFWSPRLEDTAKFIRLDFIRLAFDSYREFSPPSQFLSVPIDPDRIFFRSCTLDNMFDLVGFLVPPRPYESIPESPSRYFSHGLRKPQRSTKTILIFTHHTSPNHLTHCSSGGRFRDGFVTSVFVFVFFFYKTGSKAALRLTLNPEDQATLTN